MKKRRIIPIFIPHAGCRHNCVFCNQRLISNTEKFTTDTIEKDILLWLDRMKGGGNKNIELAFYGGSFTALDEKIQEDLLSLANKYDSIKEIRISTRPDCMTENTAKKLYAHGVRTVEFGAQFLNDAQLLHAKRGHSVGDIYEAVKIMRAAVPEMCIGLQLLIGFSGESMEILQYTADEVIRIQPDIVRLYPLLVLNGTELADWYSRGEYVPLTLAEAVARTAYLYERFMQSGINVIRIGLQASEELSDDTKMIAGPYHPSFGELVQSQLFLQKINGVLDACLIEDSDDLIAMNKKLEIFCNEKDLSKIRGNNNSNVKYWQEKYGFNEVNFIHGNSFDKWIVEIKTGKIIRKIKIL